MDAFSCLAVDMGAGSIRIVQGIFTDILVLKEVYRFENSIEYHNGHDRWNLSRITSEITTGIRLAIEQSQIPIISIGVDSWGVDFVLLNKEGKAIEDAVAYRDLRTEGMQELWSQTLDDFETFKRTGINYNVFNSLYQLLSLKGSALLKKSKNILFMADYVNYFLSGKKTNELTLSGTSQLMNVASKTWDIDILNKLEINGKLSEQLTIPGTYLEQLTIDNNVDVIAVPGHDTACAVAAIPYSDDNFAFIATGTWCIAGILSEDPLLSETAYRSGITNEIAANGKFRPLKNLMGLWLIQQLRIAFGEKHSFAEIDEMAASCKNTDTFIDTSDPIFYNPANMKDAFDLYFSKKGVKTPSSEAEYYRCAYESLACSFKETISELERLRDKPFSVIHLTGGGSQSKLLCQLTAKYIGLPVIAGPVEGAAIGNIMVQAISKGIVANFNEGRKLIANSFDVQQYNP